MASEMKQRRNANEEFALLSKVYHRALPVGDIDKILVSNGFQAMEEGIYCGREGRTVEKVGQSSWVSMSWYKMEVTGNYEVTVYIS